MLNLKITISGEPGCGKTTVARLVSEKLDIAYASTGALQRELAAERGISTLELNEISNTDPSIDSEIDSRTVRLGARDESIVVDSRLAWRFLPASLKVLIVCPLAIAARRVFEARRSDEQYADVAGTEKALAARYNFECERFWTKYAADLKRIRNYDLILDSSILTAAQIAERIVALAADPAVGRAGPTVFLSPRQIYATADARGVGRDASPDAAPALGDGDGRRHEAAPFGVVRIGEQWFATEAHDALSRALDAGLTALRCACAGQDDEVVDHRLTARGLVLERAGPALWRGWEEAFGFTYRVDANAVWSGLNKGVAGLRQEHAGVR